mgnify:CR=1 FL=1
MSNRNSSTSTYSEYELTRSLSAHGLGRKTANFDQALWTELVRAIRSTRKTKGIVNFIGRAYLVSPWFASPN